MKTNTRIAIAGLLSAAGSVLTALASEFNNAADCPANAPAEPASPADAPTPVKARKPKAEKPAPVEEPAAETTEAAAEEPAAANGSVEGKTFEELKALIEPFVKAGQGLEVKKLIAKYDPESATPSIKTMPAKNHAAFERDLAPLGY